MFRLKLKCLRKVDNGKGNGLIWGKNSARLRGKGKNGAKRIVQGERESVPVKRGHATMKKGIAPLKMGLLPFIRRACKNGLLTITP